MGVLVMLKFPMVFWAFQGYFWFKGYLVILKVFWRYFDHFKIFRGILVIWSFHVVFCTFWAFTEYFAHFEDSIGMSLFFRGLKGILVIECFGYGHCEMDEGGKHYFYFFGQTYFVPIIIVFS